MARHYEKFKHSENTLKPFEITSKGQQYFAMPSVGQPFVFINGAYQRVNIDYTVSNDIINFMEMIPSGSVVSGYVLEALKDDVSTTMYISHGSDTLISDGSDTYTITEQFPINSNTLVIVDGLRLSHDEYQLVNNKLIFKNAPVASSNILLLYLEHSDLVLSNKSASPNKLTIPAQRGIKQKNQLINGNFDIWQRGDSFSNINSVLVADHWEVNSGIGEPLVVTTKESFGKQSEVPHNPKYYVRMESVSTPSSPGVIQLRTTVERILQFKEQTVTLSFYARGSGATFDTFFAYNYGSSGSVYEDNINQIIHPLNTTWEKYKVTFTVSDFASKIVSGQDDGFEVHLRHNNANGQYFEVAQVQLEFNDGVTEFEYRSVAEELRLCQRYYEKSYASEISPGATTFENSSYELVNGTSFGLHRQQFKVSKHHNPTVSVHSPVTGSTGHVWFNGATDAPVTVENITNKSFQLTSGSNYNAGEYYQWHYIADSEIL